MIYLDNAATGFPKPLCVPAEVVRCLTRYAGNPGRGAHPLSLRAAEEVFRAREAVADFLGVEAPERVIFVRNTTEALNLAIKGFLRRGEHVLISELEHNAVWRPLCRLRAQGVADFDVFPVLGKSTPEILAGIRARITPRTSALIALHASNICSVTLPLAEIGALCKKEGLKFMVDAAQSAGHLPLDMRAIHADALAVPGHKGLLGMQGVGVLALAPAFSPLPLLEGGSGVASLSEEMPEAPPERYEAGTLPTPAIAALRVGIEYVKEQGLDAIAAQDRTLFLALRERLSSLRYVKLHAPEHAGAVLLFHCTVLPSTEIEHLLAKRDICVRAGYHCAPLAHKALGTPPGGAVRVSFGPFNTLADVDSVWKALRDEGL